MRERHRSGALGAAVALSLSNGVSALLGAAASFLVARMVAPEVLGSFKEFGIPLMYMTALHLGTFDGLYREIPYAYGEGRKHRARLLAAAARNWNIAVSAAASFAFAALATAALLRGNLDAALGWFTQVAVALGIFYGGYLAATCRTVSHFKTLARVQSIQAVVALVGVGLLLLKPFLGLCLRTGISATVGVYLLHRSRPFAFGTRGRWPALKRLIAIGLPLSAWGTLSTAVWSGLESSLVLALGGTGALGLAALSVTIREAASIVPQAINQVLTPRVVERYAAEKKIGGVFRSTMAAGVVLAAGTSVIAGLASLYVGRVLALVLPKYADAASAVQIGLWFPVVAALGIPINALFASNRPLLYGKGVAAGLAVFVLVTSLLSTRRPALEAVFLGSLIGRLTRVILAVADLHRIARSEEAAAVASRQES